MGHLNIRRVAYSLKTHNSKRTLEMIPFAGNIPRCLLLSGTPVLNTMQDLWSQLVILDAPISDNFYVWRKQFFTDRNAGMPSHKYFPDWRPKQNKVRELRDIVAAHSMRVTKEDVLDLPPLVRQSVDVDLLPEQRKLYFEMETNFLALLEEEGEAVVAEVALTRLLRLLQICNGILATDEGTIRRTPTAKTRALAELLEDIAPYHKVIVWANFIECYKDIGQVCEQLKLPYAIIRGGQKLDQRQGEIDRFQHDDRCRVMIANQAAGGTGRESYCGVLYDLLR